MGATDDASTALAEFPELQRLIDLRAAGWTLLPTVTGGEVVEVHGVRTWPDGWADAIRVRYTTDVQGLRMNYAGEITWQREGTLVEVIDGLIALPAPGMPGAPRLVIARAPGSQPRDST